MIGYDDLHDEEVRQTDHATGGQKGAKLTQVGSLDPVAMIGLARVAGMGAMKYAPFNYLKGYDWSLSYNAMQRHANLFWAGEERDVESNELHVLHAAWHALALASFILRGLGTDDRPPRLVASIPDVPHWDVHPDRVAGCWGCDQLIAMLRGGPAAVGRTTADVIQQIERLAVGRPLPVERVNDEPEHELGGEG